MKAFRVLYEDDHLIAVDKPAGFHCHPPEDPKIKISPAWNGLKILETQFKQKLFPAHRLDRATSGIFLLSKNKEIASLVQQQFQNHKTKKIYVCVVRGSIGENTVIDRPLKKKSGELMPATTEIFPLCNFVLPITNDVSSERDFTFVLAQPHTGRYHQIRRHLAHLGHPIVGDKQHGDQKLNRAFFEIIQTNRLLLRAMQLEITHPTTNNNLFLKNRWNKDWHKVFEYSGVCPILLN